MLMHPNAILQSGHSHDKQRIPVSAKACSYNFAMCLILHRNPRRAKMAKKIESLTSQGSEQQEDAIIFDVL